LQYIIKKEEENNQTKEKDRGNTGRSRPCVERNK